MSEINLEALYAAHTEKQESEQTSVPAECSTEKFTPEEKERIAEIKEGIDFLDSCTAVEYGIGTQRRLTEFTDTVLDSVKSKDGGQIGDLLGQLVTEIKAIDGKANLLDKLLPENPLRSLKKLRERYTKAESQINRIEAQLEKARINMLRDIGLFDVMYQENLECFRELTLYIEAGKQKAAEARSETIPKLRQEMQQSVDPMSAQLVQDFEDTVDRFEKKLYDLELSRTISMQSAPQIRLIQNNDRVLVDKLQTAILNTIPIWKNQFIIAVGLNDQKKALKMQQEITETTNEMLKRNAELLKQNTADVMRESNRGIVDVETLRQTNQDLISTIEETIQIQNEGRQQRARAEEQLAEIENRLRQKLVEVRQ